MRYLKLMGLATSLLALGGCVATSPKWDASFGDSVRVLKVQQLIDPQAPERNAQVTPPGDGRTARESMKRHVETYRSPPPTNIINIGVGAGGNGN
jgi:hypothetical protein